MTVFLTSDLHFGHERIISLTGRPWATVEEMNDGLVERWNSVVAEGDDVWVLGDLALGNLDESLRHVGRLNGNILLLPGNHDRCWDGHSKRPWAWRRTYLDAGIAGFLSPTDFEFDEAHVSINHFPFADSAHARNDRYRQHHPIDRGQWLFHGHVHDAWQVNGRMVNVGVEAWDYTPVSVDHLMESIVLKEGNR